MGTDNIEKRVFIVGVPRSGTTLLQSFLASHSRIHSFPETHFFSKIIGAASKKQKVLFIRKIRRYFRLMKALGDEGIKPKLFPYLFCVRADTVVRDFRQTLDQATMKSGKTIWLEKTPVHIRFVDFIGKHIPEACFLHIIRDGRQVVASLFEASNRYPEKWGGAIPIAGCVHRWNADVMETVRCSGKPKHFIVEYELLVRKPRTVLEGVCRFLNIGFEDALLKDRAKSAARIVNPEEFWKENNFKDIELGRGNFETVFTSEQQAFIVEHLTGYDMVKQMIRDKLKHDNYGGSIQQDECQKD